MPYLCIGLRADGIELWCNGNTADFGSVVPGSSPGSSTKAAASSGAVFFMPFSGLRLIGQTGRVRPMRGPVSIGAAWRSFVATAPAPGERLFREHSAQCAGELIGTRGAAALAVDSAEPFDHLRGPHTADQRGDSRGVALAAAREADASHDIPLQFQVDLSGTGALSLVGIGFFHGFFRIGLIGRRSGARCAQVSTVNSFTCGGRAVWP